MESIKKTYLIYLIFTTILPLLVIGVLSIYISYSVIEKELLTANNSEVRLIVKSAKDYLNEAEKIILSLKNNILEGYNPTNQSFVMIEDILTNSHDFITGIQISDSKGIVRNIHPYDPLIFQSDISGHEYFKRLNNTIDLYWSPSFVSEIRDTPVVSLSTKTRDFVITMFLSLEGISSLALYTQNSSSNFITITDQNGVFISHPDSSKVKLRENNINYLKLKEKWNGDGIREITDIDGEKYLSSVYFLEGINWMVSLNLPLSELYKPGMFVGIVLIIISLILIFTVLLLGTRFNSSINRSLKTLLEYTGEIKNGNYDLVMPEVKYLEFKELSDSFDSMSVKIKGRENELKEAHKELSLHKDHLEDLVDKRTEELNSTIENLQLTQKQLVESEKMASLGELVAGISHEINTPLGIIVTGASYLEETVKKLTNKMEDGSLTKKDLLDYNHHVKGSVDLILSNSRRASNLVQSFKQVSADQTSDFKRKFNINEYLHEIIKSLHPQYKKLNILFSVDCSEELVINSYPGAYAQIITNLIMNSIHHGFEGSDKGHIKIYVTELEGSIEIIYSDDGNGMTQETSSKLFEPFYTTKRGAGGTGLGMHIVYNVVSQKLGGVISCISSPGKGVEFTIKIPV